jgi:WD40 repeat protein
MKSMKIKFLKEFKSCVQEGRFRHDAEPSKAYMDEFEGLIDFAIQFNMKNDAVYYRQEMDSSFRKLVSFESDTGPGSMLEPDLVTTRSNAKEKLLKMIAVTKKTRLEDEAERKYPKYTEQTTEVRFTVIDQDSKFIFNGNQDGSVDVYEIPPKNREEISDVFLPHFKYQKICRGAITYMHIDHTNEYLFVGSESGNFKIFNIKDMQHLSNRECAFVESHYHKVCSRRNLVPVSGTGKLEPLLVGAKSQSGRQSDWCSVVTIALVILPK